jgi:RNA polymerase sigma-70 factor, ECF subfamily
MQVTSLSPTTASLELATLVVAVQNGDKASFQELVIRTHKMLRKIALPLLPSSQVDDALQETYLLVFKKLHYLKNPKAFKTWLSRIAIHVCYDLRRKHKPAEPLSACPDQVVESEELLDVASVRKALGKLKRKDRNILILREYLEASYEEIGEILDLPPGTVKSRLFHARKKMEKIVQAESEGELA